MDLVGEHAGFGGGGGIHERVGLLEAAREYRPAAELAVIGCRVPTGKIPPECSCTLRWPGR